MGETHRTAERDLLSISSIAIPARPVHSFLFRVHTRIARFNKGVIGFRILTRFPFDIIVVSSLACPWVECVDHVFKFLLQFRDGPPQDALERRWINLMEEEPRRFHALTSGSVVHDPFHPKMRVEFRPETGRKETVTEQAP